MTHYTGSVPESPRKPDWRRQAACRGHANPDIFYAKGTTGASQAELEEAKAICRSCPVQLQCGAWAVETREPFGTWGGVSQDERRLRLRIRVADGEAEPRRGHRPLADCGTESAYDRHVRRGEPIDDACRAAHTRASAERRERAKEAPKKREPAKCGTRPGYQRHRKNGEVACDACRQANTDADNRLRRTGTTKPLAA
jgi:hypothetical protein